MAPHLLTATGTDDALVLDLTDEEALLAEDYTRSHREGVRALLAALNLQPQGAAAARANAEVFDLAVFRATGDRRLATLFGTARHHRG